MMPSEPPAAGRAGAVGPRAAGGAAAVAGVGVGLLLRGMLLLAVGVARRRPAAGAAELLRRRLLLRGRPVSVKRRRAAAGPAGAWPHAAALDALVRGGQLGGGMARMRSLMRSQARRTESYVPWT